MNGAGAILSAVRLGLASTRSELVRQTGMARGTVSRRVDALLEQGLLVRGEQAASTGGRPSETFHLNPDVGVLLVADVGATRARVAVCDFLGAVLAEHEDLIDVAEGPEPVLAELDDRWTTLRRGIGDVAAVRGVGIGVPGPVDQKTGATVSPPIMTGWDRYPVRAVLAERYGCFVHVDNDVNVMAVGEQREVYPDHASVLFVKVGTGVGAGLVLDGRVFRGAIGAAGDLGHTQVGAVAPRRCRCGNHGCVEATAGGWALRQSLVERGVTVTSSRDVVELVRQGDADAVELVRSAGNVLGIAISAAVNLLNPSVVVLGGDFAEVHPLLLAVIKSVVYERSLPLATADLLFAPSRLGRRAGVVGAAHMVAEQLLDPDRVDRELSQLSGTP